MPLKKETKQTIGASVTLKYGVRIDSIKPKEIMDKTKQFQVLDRIVKINGEDVTPLDKHPELKAILDKYAPDLMFTVSRFSGVMLEAAREEIKKVKDAIAKLEAQFEELRAKREVDRASRLKTLIQEVGEGGS